MYVKKYMHIRPGPVIGVSAGLILIIAGCGNDTAAPETADTAGVAEEPVAVAAPAVLPRTASPEGARVFFITPGDGDTVSNPVAVEFGISGMTVAPAGDNTAHSGHHHLIIDAALPDPGQPIPANDNYVHFGDASTSTELTLAPGEHTLQLLLGDYLHIPHDPPVTSRSITITVE